MEDVLLVVAIVALLFLGLVILVALNWEKGIVVASTEDHDSTPARAPQRAVPRPRKQPQRTLRPAVVATGRAVRARTLALGSRTSALAVEWSPRVIEAARVAWYRRPSLESTTGQVILAAVVSLLAGLGLALFV